MTRAVSRRAAENCLRKGRVSLKGAKEGLDQMRTKLQHKSFSFLTSLQLGGFARK
jgi:16S rRNA U516 pseudouridylate synthase RsuA-like enzyme